MSLVYSTPQISTSLSHTLTFLFAACYVGSLYISKNARLSFAKAGQPQNGTRMKRSDERLRDDPDVIRARLLAVTSATVVCCGMVFALLRDSVGDRPNGIALALDATLTRLGFKIGSDPRQICPHLVTPLLFLGPLFSIYLANRLPLQNNWTFQNDFVNKIFCWTGIRNYIWAPITEEIVFRACVLSVYQMSGASKRRMIFLAPLSFGLAHVHHAWETYSRYGKTANAAKTAIGMSAFQFLYTTLFGFHSSYLFLRTGTIYAPISAHCFCNLMGFPELGWELRTYPQHKRAILVAYLLGIVAFGYTLGPWTEVKNTLYWGTTSS